MQKLTRFKLSIGTTLAGIILVASPVAVYARQGSDGTSGSSISSTSTSSSGSGSGTSGSGSGGTNETQAPTTATNETEHAAEVETHAAAGATELRHQGDDMLAELHKKQGGAKKTNPEKQKKVCEAHKDGLTNKFSHITTNSQRAQTRIDDIFAKGLAFQQSSSQTPAGFEALVIAANTAKANSAASITALQAVAPTVDCNSTSVASDVATFKAAAQQTRDNLKAYKTAVKAVLHSLENAKDATEGSTN